MCSFAAITPFMISDVMLSALRNLFKLLLVYAEILYIEVAINAVLQ